MKKIRYGLIVLWMLTCSVTSATAEVSIGIGLPSVSIGINLPVFPELVPVPGYPVYYAPRLDGNYFFYDGMYWVYQDDNWYASSWYNGPWSFVEPEVVPLFILRVPVRYYRQPPVYFRGWQSNAAPRWDRHWGHEWEQHRRGWDRWDRRSAPTRAPLPVYQRQYSRDRYPHVEQQHQLRSQSYRYQPRDRAVRQHFQQVERRAPAPAQRGGQEEPRMRSPRQQQDIQRSAPHQQGAPAGRDTQPSRRGGENVQRPVPEQTAPQQRGPESHEQRQRSQGHEQKLQGHEQRSQERGESQGHNRGQGQGHKDDDDRGRGRDK
ncbi:MAG: hypothetical protein H7Y05_04430 [Steroidobacteraceae bacterium]|nr:hypothetical protein [Deltaproteobacteria bacterium]